MKLVVTGGAGFIGSNFVRNLLVGELEVPNLSEVVVIDALTYAGTLKNLARVVNDSRLTFVKADICDSKTVSPLLKGASTVINFAAESHVDRSLKDASRFSLSNVVGTQVLLDACVRQNVEKFIQISTDEVYGSIDSGSWTESQNLSPNSPYSASKAAADLLALSYHRSFGIDVRITRSCNNYGPFQNAEKVIPRFVTNLLEGEKIPIYGNGSNIREWIHVDDHCAAILKVLLQGEPGEIYNVGTGLEITNLELAHIILDEFGLDEKVIAWVEDRVGHDYRYSLNCEKIRTNLDFEAKVDFLEGLKSTIRWYGQNIDWWKIN